LTFGEAPAKHRGAGVQHHGIAREGPTVRVDALGERFAARLGMDKAELEIGFRDFEHLAAPFRLLGNVGNLSGRSDLAPGANAK